MLVIFKGKLFTKIIKKSINAGIRILRLRRYPLDFIRIAKFLAIFCFFAFFFLSFLRIHVYNNDFWWHLANGKYIVEHKSLPENDPFSYTAHEAPSDRKSMILKGYWLAEVVFYEVFSLWSFKGIIILRSLLLSFFLFFSFLNVKRQNVSDLFAIILTAGVFAVASGYAGERPQLFTFLIFAIVYYLLEDFRLNKSKKIYFIPLFAALLSNMHLGYIVCVLLIAVYLIVSGFRHFIKKDSDFKILLMISILTVAASALNPNRLIILREIFSIGKYTENIVESMPTFYLYAKKVAPVNYSYVAFLALSLLSLRYIKKIGAVHISLLAIFSIMSFVSIRYVIFYMCIAAPILAGIIMRLSEEDIFKKPMRLLKAKEKFLTVVFCIVGMFLIFKTIPSFAGYEFKENTFAAAPKGAADFLKDKKIEGNMFNELGFGGYLIWRLYPDKKVFIDGRALELDTMSDYEAVIAARLRVATTSERQTSWEDVIKKYNISYIIMPPLLLSGEIYPIVEKLFDSKDWLLTYSDHLSLVFFKRDSGNGTLIKEYARNKEDGFNTIIAQASGRAMQNRTNPYYLITLGKVFFKMGKLDDAEKAFSMAYERDPGNAEIRKWLETVRKNGE